LEAMAAGAAVVGVAEGGVVETVQDGKTGLLAPREAKAFGQAVRQMLAQPEMTQRLCLAARDQVRLHRRWEDHMAQLEKILRAGVNHASGRKR
jgi:glycosyltransferase involved in cell wall biosynthesis